MRFQVSRVMDTIELRLTTDVTLAQAVVDLGAVARYVALDGGRPVNVLRIGMVLDALARYLVDAGALLYPVLGRELLSEPSLTSKERMVLGRWADDGLIEVTPVVTDRPVEVADFTGVPLIAVGDYSGFVERFPWLTDSPERVLRLSPRAGGAVLRPEGGDSPEPETPAARAVAVGKATPSFRHLFKAPAPADVAAEAPASEPKVEVVSEVEAEVVSEPEVEVVSEETAAALTKASIQNALQSFTARGALRVSSTRVVRRRFTRADPSGVGGALMAREWTCPESECSAFGPYRRIGQPVPRMRGGVPACPRHAIPVRDAGPRPPAYAVCVVVDDLARRRFLVNESRPVVVGRQPDDPDAIAVGDWLHEAAAAWIAPEHLELEVIGGQLVVTDASDNGTLVWKRSGPEDSGQTLRLYRQPYILGDWDSVELYTGVELVRADRRLAAVIRDAEPLSVLLDAPTVALMRPDFTS